MSKNNNYGRRGRPVGFRLSEESRRAISMSKMGQRHRQDTKDKISKALVVYFKRISPLSEEITCRYSRYNDDYVDQWLEESRDEIDMLEDVMTNRALKNSRRIEIACGNNIEYFSHNLTPEILILYKDFCEKNDLDPDKFLDSMEEIWDGR